MQKVTGAIILTITLAFCTNALCADLVQEVETGEDGSREWAAHNYDSVITHVFGEPSSSDLPSPEVTWIVTARIRSAYDEAGELQFSLSKAHGGKVGAELIRAVTPLIVQIDDIHRVHPDLDAAAVAKLVRLERRAIEATPHAPALARLAKTFEALRPLVAVENVMVLDPRQYQVWIDAGSQQVFFNLLGPSSGDGRHALIRWVENAQKELCRELAKTPSAPKGQ